MKFKQALLISLLIASIGASSAYYFLWKKPVTTHPVDGPSLKKLLHEYPLTKSDLAAILKSSAVSKDEVKQLLEEFSR